MNETFSYNVTEIKTMRQPQPAKDEIRKKLYNKCGKHVGIAKAFKAMDTGEIRIGWSVCNPKDCYNKELAETVASGRAVYGSTVVPPKFVQEQLAAFAVRAEKYFNNPNGKRVGATRKKMKAKSIDDLLAKMNAWYEREIAELAKTEKAEKIADFKKMFPTVAQGIVNRNKKA